MFCEFFTRRKKRDKGRANHDPVAEPIVLLIDDDGTSRAALSRMLRAAGITALEVPNGKGAAQILRQGKARAALAFMDMDIPGENAVERLRLLLAIDPNLPVIAMSGWAPEGEIAALMQAGAKAFIEKPLTLHEIRGAIAELGRK